MAKLFYKRKYGVAFFLGIALFIIGLLLEIFGGGQIGTIASLAGVFLSGFSMLTNRQGEMIDLQRGMIDILKEIREELR